MKREDARKIGNLLIFEGALLVVLGLVAISFAAATTKLAVTVLGFLMLIGGVARLGETILHRTSRGFLLRLIGAVLLVLAGIAIVVNPVRIALGLAILLGIFFILRGSYQLGYIIADGFSMDQGWLFLASILNYLIGIVILVKWPISMNVIGLFIGIDLILDGWALIMVTVLAKSLADELGEEPQAESSE